MMFKVCGRWRTTEACLYYQIGLGEKKKRTESSTNHMVSALCILVASTVKFYVQEFHKLAPRLSLTSYPNGLKGAWGVFFDSISYGKFVSVYIST